MLPTNGASIPVDSVGPTFWIGGAVNDPNSLLGQAFLELQFYPNSLVNNCASGGGYNVSFDPGVYTVCSPVWEVSPHGNSESAAFNAMLTDSAGGGPLVMHQGDTITDHQYVTPAADGMHITVTDVTTGHAGTIVLEQQGRRPADAGLQRAEARQLARLGPRARRAERAGLGDRPHGELHEARRPVLLAGQRHEAAVLFVRRADLAAVPAAADQGRHLRRRQQREELGRGQRLRRQGGGQPGLRRRELRHTLLAPTLVRLQQAAKAFTYGGDYPGTTQDFGQADQFQQTTQCGGPFGANSTYCATVLK